MIKILHGDLLKSNERLIAHGCNAQGVMGSGIAKQIKLRYPEVYEAYKKCYEDYLDKMKGPLPLGKILAVDTYSDMRTVINCITQNNYGADGSRYVSYDAIDSCFEKIAEYMELNNIDTIGIPMIGAGLGGGDWDVIHAIITARMTKFNVNVYVL